MSYALNSSVRLLTRLYGILQISWIEQDLKKSLVYKKNPVFTHWYTCRQLVVPNTVLSTREFFIAHNVYYPSLTNHSQWGRHYR